MRFKTYLNEAVIGSLDKDVIDTAQEMMESIKSRNLFESNVLYRGFSGKNNFGGLYLVTNNRKGFYGGLSTSMNNLVTRNLKVKHPTFVSTDITQAGTFGPVNIFIPSGKTDYHYSLSVHDGLTSVGVHTEDQPEDLEDLASTYNKVSNPATIPHNTGEVIVDARAYYLIRYPHLVDAIRSKYFTPKDERNLKYKDIYTALKAFVSYQKWRIENGASISFRDQKRLEKKRRTKKHENDVKRYQKRYRNERFKLLETFIRKLDIPFTKEESSDAHKLAQDGKSIVLTFQYKNQPKKIEKMLPEVSMMIDFDSIVYDLRRYITIKDNKIYLY